MIFENKFMDMVREGKKPVGTFIVSGNVDMTEAACLSGADYLIFDNEHTPYEAETTANMIIAAENYGVTPMCRVREVSRPAILKLLDLGAKGLIIPSIKTVDQVKRVVEYGKYKPVGDRGYTGTRKDGWGTKYDIPICEQMKAINDSTAIIPQCETVEALEMIDSLTQIEGVDGIFVGPFDLSTSMGIPGEFDNPEFKYALERIIDACRSSGVFSMIFCGDVNRTISYYNMGFDTVAYNSEISEYIISSRSSLNIIRNNI